MKQYNLFSSESMKCPASLSVFALFRGLLFSLAHCSCSRSEFHWKSNAFQWFDFHTHGFTYQGRNASQECSAALRKAKKKFATRGLFISAMSHVKLIAETRVYICHKNTKSMAIFLQFFDHIDASTYKMPSCYSAVIFNTKGSRCKG